MILQPSWSNSPELHFFKGILRCKVALGIKRTRHQLAPALPVQKIMDRAVAGCVPDRPLIGRLEIMDVSTSRTFGEKCCHSACDELSPRLSSAPSFL
jgi:hypothetical protein